MRCGVSWVLVVALAVGMSACTDPDPSTGPGTTAPGLAAAVLAHVDRSAVTGVDGAQEGSVTLATVHLSGPDVETVVVTVGDGRRDAVTDCGFDHGYVSVECTAGPHLRDLMVRGSACEGPVLIGRYDDDARGHVLVQVFGEDTPAGRELVRDLLDDEAVGRAGSVQTEEQGRDLRLDGSSLVLEAEAGPPERC